MKKILASLLLLSVAVGYADGQTALTGNKFADNWAIGVNAGGTTPLTHHSFFKNMRPVVGVHVDKYLTPAFGLSLEAMGSFATLRAAKRLLTRQTSVCWGWSTQVICLRGITVLPVCLRLRPWQVSAGCIIT